MEGWLVLGQENMYATNDCKNRYAIEENRGATEACGENRHASEENRDAIEACGSRHATEEDRGPLRPE